ncbi:MAG TPA: SDR family oxidoreductase [Tepidisphaeraceae bacterium]|jgi:short-subunit dehydrogenase
MSVKLKPLSEQVVLITGASSGIGLVTAKHAAAAGAKVVLVARNEEALQQAAEAIRASGGDAVYAIADVADVDQFKAAADLATTTYGRIDTWVNNAGVGLFGDITKNTEVDDRKLFDTNFWGIVNGSRLAVQYLRDSGGALINLGSEVSDVAVPVQGMYAASKHAILGFTDAFRMEIIKAELPISVTLIKPAAIDTPFAKHAQNNTENATTLPAPVYAPELVADQILHAAENPVRELYVGGGGRIMALLGEHFPTIADWVMGKFMPGQQLKNEPADHSNEGLHESTGGHAERGGISNDRMVRETSLYNLMSRHPYAVTIATAAAGAAVAYLLLKPDAPEPTAADRLKAAVRDRTSGPLSQARAAVRQYAAEPLSQAKQVARDVANDSVERVRQAVRSSSATAGRARSAVQDGAEGAGERARDAANDYVVHPAEQLISAVKKKLDQYLK